MCGLSSFMVYILSASNSTAKMASAMTREVIPVTTAEVVASPTAEAFEPHCNPLKHPVRAMSIPNTILLYMPTEICFMVMVICVSCQYSVRVISLNPLVTKSPPKTPMKSA